MFKKIAHIHIEGPLIEAAKALIPEKPNSLGWYKNHWAFLFNTVPSKRVLQVAQNTGFTVYKDNDQTIIALPHVKEYEIKKATQRFDIFAEEYKKLSKRATNIINHSINGDFQVIKTIVKNLNKGKDIMANLNKRKKELEENKKQLEGKKKEWFNDLKYQMKQMKDFLIKMENTPFELNLKKPYDPFYKNNMIGDLEHHLKEIKEIFEDALTFEDNIISEERDIKEEEDDIEFEKSNKSATINWEDYKRTIWL